VHIKLASGRLRLSAKVKHYLDLSSAKSICNSKVLPTFTYCGILQLKLTTIQGNRLASFYDRIIQRKSSTKWVIQSVENADNIRACKLVRNCLGREATENFQIYFEVQDHEIERRKNLCLLKFLKIRAEHAHKSIHCMGAKVYNELPMFNLHHTLIKWISSFLSDRSITIGSIVKVYHWLAELFEPGPVQCLEYY